jgi:cell wall-associated NlpC family hydrolase
MPMKIKPQVFRNITKSLGYATTSAFGDLMPTVKNTMQNNRNYIAEAYKTARDNSSGSDFKNTYIYKTTEDLLKNVKNDWRSGEWFNKKRQKEAEDNFFKNMGMDFDFDSMFNDDGSSSSDDDSSVTNNTVNNTNNVFMMDTGINETIDSGINRLGSVSMSALKLNQLGISTINKQMSSLLEFQQDNTVKFYNDVSSKLGDIASNMAQSTGFLGVMADVSVGGISSKQRSSELRDLLDIEGLDLEAYVNLYKKKLSSGGMKDTFEMFVKPMVDEWVANPIGNAMKLGIKTILPKAFKSALGEFDQMFKYLPTMMQGKLESWKDSDNKMLAGISRLFRLDVTESKNMDFSNYEKGKVSFDGITRRAIVNVIPSLLSKILASVSDKGIHKEELVYDYEKGQFTTRKRAIKGMNNDIKNFTIDSTDFKTYKEQILAENQDKFGSDDELKDFMRRIDNSMLRMVKKGTMINPETKLEDISSDPKVAQAIMDNFHQQSNTGKAKYQYDMLNASKSYYDVYQSIMDNESFHNLFDIDKSIKGFRAESNDEMIERMKEISKYVDPNSKTGKLAGKLFSMFSPNDEFNVENNMNRANPFYWGTEGIRKGNNAITDFFFGSNPKPNNTSSETPESPVEPLVNDVDDSGNVPTPVTKQRKKGVKRFFNIIGDLFANNDEGSELTETSRELQSAMNPLVSSSSSASRKGMSEDTNIDTMQEHLQEKQNNNLNNSLTTLTDSVKDVTKELKENGINGGGSNSTAVANTNISTSNNEYLSLLPKINDNILHIIALLEAKYGNEGVQVRKLGKLKGKFSDYKNRTFEWFNNFFSKNKGRKTNSKNPFSGIFDSIGDLFKGREGRGNLIQRLIGKEGIITTFLTKTFDTINEVVKNNLPKIQSSLGKFTESFLNFSSDVLLTALDLGKRGMDKGKGLLENFRNRPRGNGTGGLGKGASSIFGKLLAGLGSIGTSALNLGGKAIDGARSLLTRDGDRTASGSKKKFKFSMPEIFDKIFNKEKDTINVHVESGYLDGIREVVKVEKHVGDRNSASEQLEDFRAKQQEKQIERLSRMRGTKNGNGTLIGGNGRELPEEGGLTSAVAGLAGNVLSEITGEVIGNKLANRGQNGDNDNGNGRNGGRRRGLRGLFGGGRNNNDPNIIDMDNPSGQRRGLFGGLKDKFNNRRAQRDIAGGGARRGAGGVAKGVLKGVGKSALKFVPGLGLVMGGLDAISGFASGGSAFGTDPTLGQRFAGGAGGLLSGLSFGLLDEKTASQGIYRMFGGEDEQEDIYSKAGIRPQGSYADGGVIDYTGLANVHGSKDKPEMVLNSEQTTGFYNYIRQMSEYQKKKDAEQEREKNRGEFSNDPAIKTATWMEKLGKFFSPKGAGGMLFGGMLGGILGTATGALGKIGGFFKGLWDKLTGSGSAEASGGDGGGSAPIGGSLGHISEKYESGGRGPGTVGYDSTGGMSYGTYQIATNTGTMKTFMNFLKSSYPDYYAKLNAGGSPGSGGFTSAWKALASSDSKGFGEAQRAFIGQSHYQPAVSKIKSSTGIDVAKRGQAVQEVAWSTGVQHGSGGASNLWKNAGVNEGMTDEEIVKAVYAERKKVDKYFSSSTSAVKQSVLNRFNNEEKDVLNFLKNGSGGDPSSSGSGGGGGGVRDKVVQGGQTYVGKLKYAFGGTNIEGGSGDCSAFTRHVFKKFGSYSLGRTTGDQVNQGTKVADGSEQPGDLVFFKNTYNSSHPYGVSHVGIVIGGGKMVHLASSGCGIANYKTGYWGEHYLMVRSYLSGGSSGGGSSSSSDEGTSTATPKSNFDQAAQETRDGWYQDVWGNRKYDGSLGYSDSTAGWTGGPTSSYTKQNSFSNLGSIAGKVLGNGQAYVGDWTSGGDRSMEDSRWKINNSTVTNANSLVQNLNRGFGSGGASVVIPTVTNGGSGGTGGGVSVVVPANVVTGGYNGGSGGTGGVSVVNPSTIVNTNNGSTSGNDISSIINNKTIDQITNRNADDINLIQNLMKQLNETSQKGNDTLAQMLDVLVEIREGKTSGGNNNSSYAPIPVTVIDTNNNSNSSNNNTSTNKVAIIDNSGFGGGSPFTTGIRGSGAGSSQPASQELGTLLAGY